MTGTNAQRARNGERPTCCNRLDFPSLVEVQDGWQAVTLATPEGMTATVFAPAYDVVANHMSKHCASWAVRAPDPNRAGDTGEDPATESIPGQEGWLCWVCRHLPEDERVIGRAREMEEI